MRARQPGLQALYADPDREQAHAGAAACDYELALPAGIGVSRITCPEGPQQKLRPGDGLRAPLSDQAALFICRLAVNLLRVLVFDLLVCRQTAVIIQARMVFRI